VVLNLSVDFDSFYDRLLDFINVHFFSPFFIAFLAIITAKMRPGFLTINKNLIGQDQIANI
jgi:hypothetical protein